MKQLALSLALSGALALALPAAPAWASMEDVQSVAAASDAAVQARGDMAAAFANADLKPGQYLWRDVPGDGAPRVVVSLSDQMAYLYRGSTLVAVSTISSGKPGRDTPTGIFNVLEKSPLHLSKKYDNAPMPFMQRIDTYGIALHAGHNPGVPASHGCVRLPPAFAAKLYQATVVGTPVYIGS